VKRCKKALQIRKIKKIKNNNDETRKVALLMVLGEPLGLLRLVQNDRSCRHLNHDSSNPQKNFKKDFKIVQNIQNFLPKSKNNLKFHSPL
jgi:hypothetical protein